MIDYLRPVATSAPPYEVLFQRGDHKNQLWYMNGSDKPHCASYRPADNINGHALFSALEVVLGGLPSEILKVNIRAEKDECREELKRECRGLETATINGRIVTFHI
ncbi:MAG: hypothetical protein QXM31_03180 [Candidatus Woesearchaeota archaeon]